MRRFVHGLNSQPFASRARSGLTNDQVFRACSQTMLATIDTVPSGENAFAPAQISRMDTADKIPEQHRQEEPEKMADGERKGKRRRRTIEQEIRQSVRQPIVR